MPIWSLGPEITPLAQRPHRGVASNKFAARSPCPPSRRIRSWSRSARPWAICSKRGRRRSRQASTDSELASGGGLNARSTSAPAPTIPSATRNQPMRRNYHLASIRRKPCGTRAEGWLPEPPAHSERLIPGVSGHHNSRNRWRGGLPIVNRHIPQTIGID